MTSDPRLFISYRRSQAAAVRPAVDALRSAGVECFFDVEDIDPLADFPQRVREGIEASHAMLVWWSADYADSDHCLAEFRRAWQHARHLTSDVGRRVWVLNPEASGHHVFAGELNAKNFLSPPAAGGRDAWARTLKQRLEALLPEGPLADERQPQSMPMLRNVPTPGTRFTGRGAALLRVHSRLFPAQIGAAAAAAAVWLHGMGGLGKTEVAAKYTHDFAQAYPGGIFWLNFAAYDPRAVDEREARRAWANALDGTFALEPALQSALLHDAAGRPLPPEQARERIARWLAGQPAGDVPYLWILDNVPQMSPLDLRRRVVNFWRAPTPAGRTLATSRDAQVPDGFADEPLETLGEVDALRLLARFSPLDGNERDAAAQIAAGVGRHTIALTLLGERARRDGGYTRVLSLLRATAALDRLEALAARLRPELGEAARSIVGTFELSIAPLDAGAKRLLALAVACVPNEAIPRALLRQAIGGDAAGDDFADALHALLRASLLSERRGRDAVEIHPLVAGVAARLLPEEARQAEQAIGEALVHRLSTVMDIRSHAALADDIVHARRAAMRLETEVDVRLGNRVGRFEFARSDLAAAEATETRTLEAARRVFGLHDPETLACAGNLAVTLNALGRSADARRLQVTVARGMRQALGRGDRYTLRAMNGLASARLASGQPAIARAMFERVLHQSAQSLGANDPDTLTTMANLAEALRALDNLPAARRLQEEVVVRRLQLLGSDDPSTLKSVSNLAGTLADLGDLRAARRLYRRALLTGRAVMGPTHPDVLRMRASVAEIAKRQHRLRRACVIEQAVVAGRRERLGDSHQDTLSSLLSLARTLRALGNDERLRALLQSLPPATAGLVAQAARRAGLGDLLA